MFHRNCTNVLSRHKNARNLSVNIFRSQNVSSESHIVKCLRRIEMRLFDNLCASQRSYRAIVESRSRAFSECLRVSRGCQAISSWSSYLRSRSVHIYKVFDVRFGAKVRRTHRLWSDTCSRNALGRVRVAFGRYGKTGLVMSATGVYNNSRNEGDSREYDWSNRNISDKEMKSHLGDLSLADQLCENLICKSCLCRIKIDSKKENVKYCVCKEKDRASIEQLGWHPYMETDNLIIWRQEQKDIGLYAYKVYGSYKDVRATDLLAVHTDCEYRKSWDPTLVTVETIESLHERCGKGDVIHWIVEWPSFFANREYVFERRYRFYSASEYCEVVSGVPQDERHQAQEAIVIISRACEHPDKPEHSKAVRVHRYWSNIVIRPYGDISEKGVEFSLTYFDSAGLGSIGGAAAAAAASWAAGRGAPEYFRQMHEAARKYAEWKEKFGTPNIEDEPLMPCPHPAAGKEEVSGATAAVFVELRNLWPVIFGRAAERDNEPPQSEGNNPDDSEPDAPQSSLGESSDSPKKVIIVTTPPIAKKHAEDEPQNVGEAGMNKDTRREPCSGPEINHKAPPKIARNPESALPDLEITNMSRVRDEHTDSTGEPTPNTKQEALLRTDCWWRYLHPYYYFA